MVAEIKKITTQPIRFIINTHHHSDHAGGNPVFAKLGTIYAQKNVRNRILEGYKNSKEKLDFDPVKAAPTVTYDGELIFHLGGEEIHLYHPARAHTDGDTLVHFKNANIALWGDAFINNWVPVVDVAGGASTLEWLQFIDRGIQLVGENATMVPAMARSRKRQTCGGSGRISPTCMRTCARRSQRGRRASRQWTRSRCRPTRTCLAARRGFG